MKSEEAKQLKEHIKKLENRIEELEAFRYSNKSKDIRDGLVTSGKNFIASLGKEFDKHFLEKYSTAAYSEKDLPENFMNLDISQAIESVRQRNPAHKFRFWSKFRHEVREILGDRYYDDYWIELISFVEQAVRFYENDVIRYILKEGKYVDEGGRPSFDEDEIWELWLKYSKDPKSIYEEDERPDYEPGKKAIYLHIAQIMGCSKSKVSQTVRKIKKKRKNPL